MKVSIKKTLLLIPFFAFLAFTGGGQYETLKLGEKAPLRNYTMKSTQGDVLNLESLKGENGTLVIFSCNTCPFVIAWENRYPYLENLSKQNNIGMGLINSNEAKRTGDDSMDEMIAHAKQKNYPDIPYLVDQNSKLANAFGAKTTPHVFLFNSKWELVYEGAIDDNHKSVKEVKQQYLNKAIENLAAGKEINPGNTKAMGCSIKRVPG